MLKEKLNMNDPLSTAGTEGRCNSISTFSRNGRSISCSINFGINTRIEGFDDET